MLYHKSTKFNILLSLMLMLTILISAGTLGAYADEEPEPVPQAPVQGVAGGAYEVKFYDFRAVVNKDHSYDVEERITVNIPDTVTRIDFAIPSGNFRLYGLEVENAVYASKRGSDTRTVTILDPEKLKTGQHIYTIKYKIREFADRDSTADIFYYNVLLPEWKQPIAEAAITVQMPEDFPWDDIQYYAGQFGIQAEENRITFDADESSHVITITGKMIPENFGITLKADLPDGYWEGALDGIWASLAMIIIMSAIALILFILWLIGGRDPKIKRVRVTRPVEGVSPVELGYIFNSRTDIRDIVRLILYFGTCGYLRISEYEPKRYRLIRLREPEGEERMIRNAYSILFEDIYKGRALEMDQIGERLARMEAALKDDVAAGFSSPEMLSYTPLSRAFRVAGIVLTAAGAAVVNALKYSYQYLPVNYIESVLIGLAAAALLLLLSKADDWKLSSPDSTGRTIEIIAAVLIGALALYMSLTVARQTGQYLTAIEIPVFMGISSFLIVIMRARGRGNAELVMKFRQLRRFILTPEPKYLLENYLEDNNYYYEMLIYALTFGGEERWAMSFLTLDVPDPDWYRDDIEGHAFSNLREKPTPIDYAHDLKSFTRTIENAYQNMQSARR